jgi:hypothetical protein
MKSSRNIIFLLITFVCVQGTLFDRLYRDAIAVALTPADFDKIGVSSAELLSATSSRCALSVRILFGLML